MRAKVPGVIAGAVLLSVGCLGGGTDQSGGDDRDCDVGSEGCQCTPGGACNEGLSCASETCVDHDDPGGDGDSASGDENGDGDGGGDGDGDGDGGHDASCTIGEAPMPCDCGGSIASTTCDGRIRICQCATGAGGLGGGAGGLPGAGGGMPDGMGSGGSGGGDCPGDSVCMFDPLAGFDHCFGEVNGSPVFYYCDEDGGCPNGGTPFVLERCRCAVRC